MKQSLDDIAELAESLGKNNLIKGRVNLRKIARSKGIAIIYGHYGDYFLGELVHCSNRFYIHLNLDRLNDKDSARTRFTIAHELGHYFIDKHRIKLSNGISLSFGGKFLTPEEKQIEKQANHFASHLLMPKSKFIQTAKKYELGMAGILKLKEKFETSMECTTLHYISLDFAPMIMLKWRSDYSFQYPSYTKSFSELTGIKGSPSIKFNSEHIQLQAPINYGQNIDFSETVSPISRWISTVLPESEKDIIGLEQTIKLGEFGGITILSFFK